MHPFSCHGRLVCTWLMHSVLLLGGFKPFCVSLRHGIDPFTKRMHYGEQNLEPLVNAHCQSGDRSIDVGNEENPNATKHLTSVV